MAVNSRTIRTHLRLPLDLSAGAAIPIPSGSETRNRLPVSRLREIGGYHKGDVRLEAGSAPPVQPTDPGLGIGFAAPHRPSLAGAVGDCGRARESGVRPGML